MGFKVKETCIQTTVVADPSYSKQQQMRTSQYDNLFSNHDNLGFYNGV